MLKSQGHALGFTEAKSQLGECCVNLQLCPPNPVLCAGEGSQAAELLPAMSDPWTTSCLYVTGETATSHDQNRSVRL